MSISGRETTRAPALLLQRIAAREADWIGVFLSPTLGKFRAIAYGARKSQRRFAGKLEPFQELELAIESARGDRLPVLQSAEITQRFEGVLGSWEAMQRLGGELEFVRGALEEDAAEPEVYACVLKLLTLANALMAERATEAAHQAALLASLSLSFRARLLHLLGHFPSLSQCAVTGTPCPRERSAFFDATRGGIVSRQAGGHGRLLSARARAWLIQASDGLTSAPLEEPSFSQAAQAIDWTAEVIGWRRSRR